MAKREVLDEWAAKFVGEDEDTVADAVGSQWYTTSPGAATLDCDFAAFHFQFDPLAFGSGLGQHHERGAGVEGDAENLAELIVQACYDCHNG